MEDLKTPLTDHRDDPELELIHSLRRLSADSAEARPDDSIAEKGRLTSETRENTPD